ACATRPGRRSAWPSGPAARGSAPPEPADWWSAGEPEPAPAPEPEPPGQDRKSTRLNSSHVKISYAVFCLKKKKNKTKCLRQLFPLLTPCPSNTPSWIELPSPPVTKS